MEVVFVWLGIIIMVVGNLWMLVEIFQTGLIWLLGSIFIPLVALVWLVLHFREGWRPCVVSLVGAAVYGLGVGLAG